MLIGRMQIRRAEHGMIEAMSIRPLQAGSGQRWRQCDLVALHGIDGRRYS